jgi:hypothetical protein
MRIVKGVGDLVQRIKNDHTCRVLNDQMISRSDNTVCGLYRARGDEEYVFLVEPQNQG